MKKSYLALLVSALVLISLLFWIINIKNEPISIEILQIFVIILLISFGAYFGIRRLKSERLKELLEDEMSKKLLQKSSSIAFYISLYLWVLLMYIADKKIYESDVVFGIGILGMGVVFASSYFILRFIGLKNE